MIKLNEIDSFLSRPKNLLIISIVSIASFAAWGVIGLSLGWYTLIKIKSITEYEKETLKMLTRAKLFARIGCIISSIYLFLIILKWILSWF